MFQSSSKFKLACSYSVSGGDGKFTIDASSGDIRTSADPLDREVKRLYNITVVATDGGGKKVC